MTYRANIGHVMLIELGIVSKVKLLSLKHNTPSVFSVVFDTITENPKNLDAWPFLASTNKVKIKLQS